jgi:glycine/D-amino acid oxidase-like deaminating enzyme
MGRSLWVEGERRSRTFPPLSGAQDVDVAIVGGGFTGALVAEVFARAGVHVALVEADLVGRGSTAASTALLLQEPDLGLGELGRRYGRRKARRIWQLSASGIRGLVQLIRRLEIDCDLVERDSIYYTTRAEAVPPLRSEYLRRREAGFTGTWLTPGMLRRATGVTGHAAIRTTGNAQFNPYRACLGLIHAAAWSGAAIFERSPVKRILSGRHGVRVVTAEGALSARHVVVATGYATPEFHPLAGRFQMKHTYVLATPPITSAQQQDIGLDAVMLWDTEKPYHYARWTPDRRLLVGGGDIPVVSGRGRAAAFRRGTNAVRAYFEDRFPALADIGFEYGWEGLFATTPDGLPYIGSHRRYPRHLFALGYGGNGMTFGYLAARMLLEQVQGVHSSDRDLFAFGRHRSRD